MKLECPLTSTVGSNTEKDIINIILAIGYDCNYKCSYCYQKENPQAYTKVHMEHDVIENSINFIKELLQDLEEDSLVNIVFDGGEPTLYMDIVDTYIEALGSSDKIVNFIINTNGSTLHKYIKKFQYINNKFNNKLFINISYDYFLQNKNRQDYSYKKIRDNILFLDKNNVKFDIKSILPHEDLVYIHEVYKDYYELNKQLIHKVNFNYTLDITNSTSIDTVSIFDINDSFKLLIKYLRDNNIVVTGIKQFDNLLDDLKSNCDIPTNSIAIDYTGQIYPCIGALYSSNKHTYSIANVKEISYQDSKNMLFKEVSIAYPEELLDNVSKCSTCKVNCSTCAIYSKVLEDEYDNYTCNVSKLFTYYGALFRRTTYTPEEDPCVSKVLEYPNKEEALRKKLINWIEGRIPKIHRLVDEYMTYGIRRHPDLYPEVIPILQEKSEIKKQRILEEVNRYKELVRKEKQKLRNAWYQI